MANGNGNGWKLSEKAITRLMLGILSIAVLGSGGLQIAANGNDTVHLPSHLEEKIVATYDWHYGAAKAGQDRPLEAIEELDKSIQELTAEIRELSSLLKDHALASALE